MMSEFRQNFTRYMSQKFDVIQLEVILHSQLDSKMCFIFFFIKIHFINVSGQYKPDKGKELCQECEDGYYTTKEGTIECTECPAGYFCPVSIHSSPLRL